MHTTDSTLNKPTDRALTSAGVLYVVLTVAAIFGLFLPQTVIAPMDANATADKVLASEILFRLGILSNLIATIAFVFLARALHRLLSEVNKTQASLMVTLVMLSIPVWGVGLLPIA